MLKKPPGVPCKQFQAGVGVSYGDQDSRVRRTIEEGPMDHVKYWLRWLAVVPGALLGGIVLTFPRPLGPLQHPDQLYRPIP